MGLLSSIFKSEPASEQQISKLREKIRAPVFWLIGKSQSGKSSIVRTLCQTEAAEVGNGFKPCTRTARLYSFPNEEQCLIRFLDTRGLGEIDYDPSEDLAQFADEAHVLMFVMKACDSAQDVILEASRKIREHQPDWPVVVVQTGLHEGYDHPATPHLTPYPFDQPGWESVVPDKLRKCLLRQRADWPPGTIFVPVDFTHPEDQLAPLDYGAEALWKTIETIQPLGLHRLIGDLGGDPKLAKAMPDIIWHSMASGVASSIPIPFLDIPVLLGLQARLAYRLANLYGKELQTSEILNVLGFSYLGRLGARELMKFVPVAGSALAGLTNAATTYALGKTLCRGFYESDHGRPLSPQTIKSVFAEEMEAGRKKLAEYLEKTRKGG